MSETELPEPDRAENARHPRFSESVIGQDVARQIFLDAFNAKRLHHAWLLSGPHGIGKATLAWQIARFLIAHRPPMDGGLFDAEPGIVPATLSTDHGSEAGRRISALSEPGLHLLRRPWDQKKKALSAQITVDTVRKLKQQFTMSLPDGGRRVVIVDSANDMNASAANALLKLLEEPPANTVFLLISSMPSALLPTIRSRCLSLVCAPLGTPEVSSLVAELQPDIAAEEARELAELSGGSPGVALRMHAHDGARLQRSLVALLGTMPEMDRMQALDLATSLAARGNEEKRALFLDLTDRMIGQLARQGACGQSDTDAPITPQSELLRRLAATPRSGQKWASAQTDLTGRVRRGLAVNLDPHSLILDMLLRIDGLARDCAAA